MKRELTPGELAYKKAKLKAYHKAWIAARYKRIAEMSAEERKNQRAKWRSAYAKRDKAALAEAWRKSYAKHKEKRIKQITIWRERNKEKLRAQYLTRYGKLREERLAEKLRKIEELRKWKEDNPEESAILDAEILERKRIKKLQYRRKHQKKINYRNRMKRRKNKREKENLVKKWRKENPELAAKKDAEIEAERKQIIAQRKERARIKDCEWRNQNADRINERKRELYQTNPRHHDLKYKRTRAKEDARQFFRMAQAAAQISRIETTTKKRKTA